MGEYSYILEQQGKTTAEKLAEFTTAIGWRDELATYRIAQDEYEMRTAAAAEQGISLLDVPPYTPEELAALDAESAAYYEAFAANYVATAAFSGSGSGTQSDPYIITNRAEIEAMADDLTAYYQLGNNIDLGGSSSPWTPIGTSSAPFAGSLDGNSCTILGMYINTNNNCAGLFGIVGSTTFSNIGFISPIIDIESSSYPNTYAGSLYGKTISGAISDIDNCYVSDGSIALNAYYSSSNSGGAGLLIGVGSKDTRITNCWVSGTISGSAYYFNIGGIAGSQADISFSYVTDLSTSTTNIPDPRVGGIVGYVAANIQNTACVGSCALGYTGYSIIDCHRIGGQIRSGILQNNYADSSMTINGNTVSGGTTSNANGADVSPSTYHTQAFWQNTLGWDFTNTWYWDSTANLPKLRAFLHGPTISSVSATPTTGGVDTEITLSATVQDATSYQWQYSLNSGGTWQDITGATAATSTWTPGAVGTYQVQLLATNSDGTTTSDPVTVTIYPSPTISDVTIYPNPSDESATFLISATVNES